MFLSLSCADFLISWATSNCLCFSLLRSSILRLSFISSALVFGWFCILYCKIRNEYRVSNQDTYAKNNYCESECKKLWFLLLLYSFNTCIRLKLIDRRLILSSLDFLLRKILFCFHFAFIRKVMEARFDLHISMIVLLIYTLAVGLEPTLPAVYTGVLAIITTLSAHCPPLHHPSDKGKRIYMVANLGIAPSISAYETDVLLLHSFAWFSCRLVPAY